MKQISKIFFVTFILVLAFSTLAQAHENKSHTDDSSAELKLIKSLEGKWVTVSDMFSKKAQRMYVEYEVTADGSAVLEKIFPGTPHEMISVYYDDHGKLAATHYCIMHNRPTLKLSSSTEDSITMRVAKIDGLKKDQPSMGESTMTFKDKNHMTQTCKGKDDKGQHMDMSMEYTRVR